MKNPESGILFLQKIYKKEHISRSIIPGNFIVFVWVESSILKTTWYFGEICYNIITYMGVRGNCIFFAYKLWEEDLTMANGNAPIIIGSARQEHSAVFSACQVLFHTIYNEPVAGDRAHCALASAFAFAGRVVVWYWSPNHDRQINLFRLNLLPSPACPLSEEENSG